MSPPRAAGTALFLLLAAAASWSCAPRPPARPDEMAGRFTLELQNLAAEARTTARILAGLRDGPASAPAFAVLAARRAELARAGAEGEPAISAWDATGLPTAWAGPVGVHPPLAATGETRYEVHSLAGMVHLLARVPGPGQGTTVAERRHPPGSIWNPSPPAAAGSTPLTFSTGGELPAGVLPLLAPDGTRLGWLQAGEAGPQNSVRLQPSALAGLLAAFLLLVATCGVARRWLERRADGVLPPLLISAGVWGTRACLHPLLRDPALQGALTDASQFASPAIFGLFRSPADALSSGLALAAQAAVIGWALSRRAGRWPAAAAWVLALAGGAGGFLLALRAGADSRLDLLALATPAHAHIRMLILCGLFLTLWAPCLVGAAAGFPWGEGRPGRRALLAAPAAAALLFAALTWAFGAARRELVEENLRPLVLSQEHDRSRALAASRQRLQGDPEVAEEVALALEGGHADELAYRLWRRTELANRGYDSSLEIYDGHGALRGAFGVEMPPPVPAGDEPAASLLPVELQTVVFSTLSQEKEALLARWPVLTATGTIGAIALYVSNELDNVPLLRPQSPWWGPQQGTQTALSASDLLHSDPVAVAHDARGRLLWSAHPDPPPLPAPVADLDTDGGKLWVETESAGHLVRILYFRDSFRLYGVGFHVERLSDHLSRLLRLGLFLSAAALATALLAIVALASPRRVFRGTRALLRELGQSYSRKLAGAVLLASLVPLLVLALVLRGSLDRQRREILLTLGLRSVGVAERVVRDAAAAVEAPHALALPDDDTLFWLSRVIGQEIDLFADGVLVASSRRGLFHAGILPSLPPAATFRRLVLGGEHALLSANSAGHEPPTTISVPLAMPDGPPAILSLPLHNQESEVERRIAEVQELTDLATAAVALLLLGASVALGRGMSARLKRLSAATERVARGEAVVRVPTRSRDEVGRLTESFNTMAQVLGRQRAALERRTETLEKILLHAPTGIVSLDAGGHVLMANPAAGRVLRSSVPPAPGEPLGRALANSVYRRGLERLLAAPGAGRVPREAELMPEGGGESRLRAVLVDLPGAGAGRLLLLEDVTETVRSNRLAAWAEMARRIAHEIKNPLTPIRLSAEHLRRVYEQGDPRLAQTLVKTVKTILQQVDSLREIASDFSLYARIPDIRRRPVPAGRLLVQAMAPYRAAPPAGVEIQQEIAAGLPEISVDDGLIRRALVNLLENALHAMPEGGILRGEARGGAGNREVILSISDTGVGMDAATQARLFEPYFSTRDAGTGLGLAIARRAVEEHGGRIEVESHPGRGTRFSVVLPVTRGGNPTGSRPTA